MKIIFLDLDGVVNDDAFIAKALVGHEHITSFSLDLARKCTDPVRVARVQRVCDETAASVVIVSAWRRWATVEEITEVLRDVVVARAAQRAAGMSRPHKRHHRRLLARLRALFPPAHRRKVRVFRRGWSSEQWEVYVPSRAPENGAIVVAPLLSCGCDRRVEALHEAIRKRKRMLATAHESFVFREYERLWRSDGDLPLPYFSEALTGASEYDA